MPERQPTQLSWRLTLSNSKCLNATATTQTSCFVWMLHESVNCVSFPACCAQPGCSWVHTKGSLQRAHVWQHHHSRFTVLLSSADHQLQVQGASTQRNQLAAQH